jgi:hypothetical protein
VKTQRPITTEAADDEHRVLQFRPRNSMHPPGPHSPGRRPFPGYQAPQHDASQHAVSHLNIPQRHPPRHEDSHEPNDLARYEQAHEEPDDFRHRMLANLAAFAFTIALLAVGIWLAMSISDLRRTQDCVLLGRHDCARISDTIF